MNNKIYTFIISKSGECELIQLFGYANKGLPGVELVGFGQHGRHLKEKLIFLSRQNQFQFPLKRYVLCFEQHRSIVDPKKWDLSWLELPLLILFWSLTGNLPIQRLDNCISCGAIDLEGHLRHYPVDLKKWQKIDEEHRQKEMHLNYIGDALPLELQNIHLLNSEELFCSTDPQ